MRLRTNLRGALLALLLGAAPAFAGPPSDAQIDRLLELTRARDTLESMWPQLEAMQQQIVEQALAGSGQALDAQRREQLQALLARQMRTMRSTMAWERMEPIYRGIYRQTFEAEDVDAMIAFYESAAGRKLIAKTPQLMRNTMQATQHLIEPMLEQMQHDIQAMAEGADAPADPAD